MTDINQTCIYIYNWLIANNYSGIDPYLLDQKLNRSVSWIPFYKKIRAFLKPFHSFIPKFLFKGKPLQYPLVHGFSIESNVNLFKLTGEQKYLNEANKLVDELTGLASDSAECAWGLPFQWGGEIIYPPNTPFTINQALISLSLIPLYNLTKEDRVKQIVIKANQYIIDKVGYREVDSTSLGFYYSPIDKMTAYNISAVSAESLLACWKLTNDDTYYNLAKKALNFVMQKQRFDGAWEYGETSNQSLPIIDNRHTCYILGSLIRINETQPELMLNETIKRGVDYYHHHLLNDFLPKWDNEKTYPIDISDVAMCILLLIETKEFDKADKLIQFSTQKMSDGNGAFYFKYFENGNANKTVFIRWAQAWMFKALTTFQIRLKANQRD